MMRKKLYEQIYELGQKVYFVEHDDDMIDDIKYANVICGTIILITFPKSLKKEGDILEVEYIIQSIERSVAPDFYDKIPHSDIFFSQTEALANFFNKRNKQEK